MHVWTYDGEPKEVLVATVEDTSSEFRTIDFDVITTNDGNLYIWQSAGGADWSYSIYHCYIFRNSNQKYEGYGLTTDATIKYIRGFERFDGYTTEEWNDKEKFNEQEAALRSNMKDYIFTSNMGQRSSYMSNAKQVFFYDNAIEYLNKMESNNND